MLTKEQIVKEWGLDLVDPNAVLMEDKREPDKKEALPRFPAHLDEESAQIIAEIEYNEYFEARKVIRPNAKPISQQEADDKRAKLIGNHRFKKTANIIFFPPAVVRKSIKAFEEESSRLFTKGLADFASPTGYLIRRAKALAAQVKDLEGMLEVFPDLDLTGELEAIKGKKRTVFHDMEDALEEGFNKEAILKCLEGKSKTHKGYKWQAVSFAKEDIPEELAEVLRE